jgi:uncharacterized protein (TIGR00297 family)
VISLSTELSLSILALFGIATALYLLEKAHRKFHWNNLVTRKFVHVLIGFLVCMVAFVSPSPMPIIAVASVFLFINFFAVRKNKLKSIHVDTISYGTVYYPLAVLILSFWIYESDRIIFIVSILLLSVADTVASLIGRKFGRNHFVLIGEKKSLIGALAMFVTASIIISTGLIAGYHIRYDHAFLYAMVIAIPIAAVELLSIRGSDNLLVPLLSALLLKGFLTGLSDQILLAILFASAVAWMSHRNQFLDAGGSTSTLILGTIIFGIGGYQAAVPILVFFITSSLLSKFSKQKKHEIQLLFEKTGKRDYKQVLVNGGIPTLIIILNFIFPMEGYLFLYLTAVAAANADTWGTEIGIFSKKKPRLITTLKRVPRGTSGAKSPLGSIAAFAGSAVIILSGFVNYNLFEDKTAFIYGLFVCMLAGFLGSVIDSLLGASVQVQYSCARCGKVTEKKVHCDQPAGYKSGFMFFNNDLVNLVSVSLATLLIWVWTLCGMP